MRVNGINNMNYYPIRQTSAATPANQSPQSNQTVMSKEQMAQLLSFMTYQQNKMNLKLVRIAGELFAGKSIDQIV
ncbi:hypothetical protein JYK00_03420 [Thermosipho ferrireducens]|uniref:Uncharacterized protein n=1 Tax=Thermosipho ferrireducens TaxID=2571116 RepID=A0ABX7S8P6_9BACT|nr:hypothetical protein [Thermosipho ferrireducens]QTA38977.1 hypothetical protein JYK00_03420 [Thermosipho ferrireducens]